MTYLGQNIKKLGFGLMRLPMIGEDVDIEQTKQMVDLFLSKGFTYFDTAYGYLNGKSEKPLSARQRKRRLESRRKLKIAGIIPYRKWSRSVLLQLRLAAISSIILIEF